MTKVTGPDGDNPITDKQIRELHAASDALGSSLHPKHPNGRALRDLCDLAVGVAGVEVDAGGERLEDEDGNLRDADESEIAAARARCAEIWNARHGGVTDEQIYDLWDSSWTDPDLASSCRDALDTTGAVSDEDAAVARARCADAWNARHGDES